MQVPIQTATVTVMVLKEADARLASDGSTANVGQAHRHRHGRAALRQTFFDLNAPDKYVELLCFEMEVTNMLQTKAYKLDDKEEVPIMKTG